MKFGKDFIFGAATASFQIEGDREHRGDCIWDDFCDVPGRVAFGHNGNVADDHVNRYIEDVEIMKKIGLDAYRFSVSWPRILKDGIKEVNECGLDFYDRLIDRLLENGIQPFMTLYHWDLPSHLNDLGGWQNRDMAGYFGDYTQIVAKRYGDRVKNFITINEPQCFTSLGYVKGIFAPGYRLSEKQILSVIHNVLLAHGTSNLAIRANVKDAKVGFASVGCAHFPATERKEDIDACERAVMSLDGNYDNWIYNTPHWCDPIYFGRYPYQSYERFGKNMPEIKSGDMDIISAPVDFHGENVYNGCAIASGGGKEDWHVVDFPTGFSQNSLGWPITPKSLRYAINFNYKRYGKPIYITENGISCNDWVDIDGKVHDSQRVSFMRDYLEELSKAIDDGTDVKGYFAWSLLDNFEWAQGYTSRFGLVHVDYQTRERTIKDSALYYSELIKKFKK